MRRRKEADDDLLIPIHFGLRNTHLATLGTELLLFLLIADVVFQDLVLENNVFQITGLEINEPVATACRVSDHHLSDLLGEIGMVTGEEQGCPVPGLTAGVPQFNLVNVEQVDDSVVGNTFLDQCAFKRFVLPCLDGVLAAVLDFLHFAQCQLVPEQHIHGYMEHIAHHQQLFRFRQCDIRFTQLRMYVCLFDFPDKAVVNLNLLRPLAAFTFDSFMDHDLLDQLIQHFSS